MGSPVRRRRGRFWRTWTERLSREDVGDGFPDKVTAFREGDGGPRTLSASPARSATPRSSAWSMPQNEANYCPTCQTGGRLLADRALSRLMKNDWPRTLEELEARKGRGSLIDTRQRLW